MMTNLTSLGNVRQDKKLTQFTNMVAQLKTEALVEFSALQYKKTIVGDWEDSFWIYQNKNIYFTKPIDINGQVVTGKTPADLKVPLSAEMADLLKIKVLRDIKRGITAKAVSNSLSGPAWLYESIGYDLNKLISTDQNTLDATIPLLNTQFVKRGPYERLKSIRNFIKHILVANRLVKQFDPKLTLRNPALDQADVTSNKYRERRDKKFEGNIDIYLSQVKARFDADKERIAKGKLPLYPEIKPSYDELRLLAIPFLMAFGLRVGELCRLPVDCLQFDEVNQRWYLNVLTEKGQLPSAKPCPRIWQDVIVQSHKRILELSKDDRNYAKQVERKGKQAFIDTLLFSERTPEITTAIQDNGYDPDGHFFRFELGMKGGTHSSGLGYAILRNKKFNPAKVGMVSFISSDQRKNKAELYDKNTIAEIAYADYMNLKLQVYKENHIDEEVTGKLSSSSFKIEQPFSHFLFIARNLTFTGASNGKGIIPKPLTAKALSNWITNDRLSRNKTVFERYDIKDEDGNIVSLLSHQFRHWLSTAMMRSGKNEMMVDLYMGRSPGQTRHYDHRTAKERAENMRGRYLSNNPPSDALGRRIKKMKSNGVTLDELENAVNHTLTVMHYTPWGTCRRDLDVSPCEKGMMCLRGDDGQGCQHFGIDPEDAAALTSIMNTKAHYENQLSALLPNYHELIETLNLQEPLDQHIQYCIDTLKGCETAITAYERAAEQTQDSIKVVQIFAPVEK